jgi:hypothetical protein
MEKKPFHNALAVVAYIGGVMIPAGATRLVDAQFVPDAPAEAGPAPADPILELLDNNVGHVVEALPGLSDEDLDKVEAAENAGKTRKGVLEGIAADRLRRAQGPTP